MEKTQDLPHKNSKIMSRSFHRGVIPFFYQIKHNSEDVKSISQYPRIDVNAVLHKILERARAGVGTKEARLKNRSLNSWSQECSYPLTRIRYSSNPRSQNQPGRQAKSDQSPSPFDLAKKLFINSLSTRWDFERRPTWEIDVGRRWEWWFVSD